MLYSGCIATFPVAPGTKQTKTNDYDSQNYILFYPVLLLQLEGMKVGQISLVSPVALEAHFCISVC